MQNNPQYSHNKNIQDYQTFSEDHLSYAEIKSIGSLYTFTFFDNLKYDDKINNLIESFNNILKNNSNEVFCDDIKNIILTHLDNEKIFIINNTTLKIDILHIFVDLVHLTNDEVCTCYSCSNKNCDMYEERYLNKRDIDRVLTRCHYRCPNFKFIIRGPYLIHVKNITKAYNELLNKIDINRFIDKYNYELYKLLFEYITTTIHEYNVIINDRNIHSVLTPTIYYEDSTIVFKTERNTYGINMVDVCNKQPELIERLILNNI